MIHHTGRRVNSSCNSKLIITDHRVIIRLKICKKKNFKLAKGQKISEAKATLLRFNSSKEKPKKIVLISALVSKEGQIKKIKKY